MGYALDVLTHRLRIDIPVYASGSIVQGEVFSATSVCSASYSAGKIALNIEAASQARISCAHHAHFLILLDARDYRRSGKKPLSKPLRPWAFRFIAGNKPAFFWRTL